MCCQIAVPAEVRAERERIITLLADERSEFSHHSDYYNDPLGFAIALIKGDNNA